MLLHLGRSGWSWHPMLHLADQASIDWPAVAASGGPPLAVGSNGAQSLGFFMNPCMNDDDRRASHAIDRGAPPGVRHRVSDPAGTLLAQRGFTRQARSGLCMPLNCINTGGRGGFRTPDRWCVKPELYH
jgi:hypothetical protein